MLSPTAEGASGLYDTWPWGGLDLEQRRRELFEAAGYCVIRGFCSVDDTKEVRRFWHHRSMPYGEKGYWVGRPNYAMTREGLVQRYECFFWNPPDHALTYELTWSMQVLRNVLTGSPLHAGFFPWQGIASSFRPTRTDAGDPGVPSHVDRLQPGQTHLVQASLALSTFGVDYGGGGTRFCRYDGQVVNLHSSEHLQAGDLIFFNQAREHSVDPVSWSHPDDPLSGHWRVLMPDHLIGANPREGARLHEGVLAAEDNPSRQLQRSVVRFWLKRIGGSLGARDP